MEDYTYNFGYLHDGLKYATSESNMETIVYNFLDEMWDEIGKIPLELIYLPSYEKVRETNATAGWSKKDTDPNASHYNDNYGEYYTVVLFINSIKKEISKRDIIINRYTDAKQVLQDENKIISDSLLMVNNFNEKHLIRLNAFLREDELHLDDIVQTSTDNLSSSFKIKQDAMETGRIELQKRCQPQLQFSMDMANIYAIPEFAPIIDHFQLGRIILVGLRSDYIKQSRLLQIDINFEDLSFVVTRKGGNRTILYINEEVAKYTVNQIGEAKKAIQTEVLSRLRTEFESTDFMVGVDLIIAYE